MKISVCVSGQMRAIKCWDTFLPYISSDKRTSRVFLHTWHQPNTERVFRFFDHRIGQNWSPLVYSNEESIIKLKPANYLFEQNTMDVVDGCRTIGPHDVTRLRVLSMWRGQYMASSIAQRDSARNGTPDAICRTRSDLVFESDPFEFFENKPLPKNVVFVPEGPNGGDPEAPPTEALHDWFGVAEPETFYKFTSLYANVCRYFQEKPTLFPEVMLKHHVDSQGLEVVRYPVKYFIKRV